MSKPVTTNPSAAATTSAGNNALIKFPTAMPSVLKVKYREAKAYFVGQPNEPTVLVHDRSSSSVRFTNGPVMPCLHNAHFELEYDGDLEKPDRADYPFSAPSHRFTKAPTQEKTDANDHIVLRQSSFIRRRIANISHDNHSFSSLRGAIALSVDSIATDLERFATESPTS